MQALHRPSFACTEPEDNAIPASSPVPSLTERESHYDFGENWARFAREVNENHIARAEAGLARLLGGDLAGRSFLEIGCGSGLHSLAALRLGAAPVTAFDIDPRAVETARVLLGRHAPEARWTVETRSIFDLPVGTELHDIVYSWGVLHHTGDMRRALTRAASLVRPGGMLVLALYRRTPFCPLWRVEKRFYAHGPRWYRPVADTALAGLLLLALTATGRNPVSYVRHYPDARGMEFMTDVRDWLGGYPYESAAPDDVRAWLGELGFAEERFFPCNTRIGLLGVGCDEYVFRRRDEAAQHL